MNGLREMTYDQLVEYTDEVIEELRKKAYREGYEQGRFDERMESIEAPKVGRWAKKSAQEERDRIVERAKRDYKCSFKIFGYKEYSVKGKRCTAEYIVDREKRTVVVLMRSIMSNRVLAKGIAKCASNDCFNVHIGKAIALRRALGLEVPDEYLNAPQPTEVRIGDIVEYNGYKVEVCGYNDNRYMDYRKGTCQLGSIVSNEGKIIDDSRNE